MIRDLRDILAEQPFLSALDAAQIDFITGCAKNVRFEAGEFLAKEGDEAKEFFLIREGHVSVELFSPGRGAVTIQTLAEGDVVGWSWLVPPHRWYFDCRATNTVRAVAFDGECLRRKCEQDLEVGYALMKRMAEVVSSRLQATRLQLMDVYGTDGD